MKALHPSGLLVSSDGTVERPRRFGPSAPLKPYTTDGGYLQVAWQEKGVRHSRSVAALVLETFVGPAPEGSVARFKNGDRLDCRLENLAWGRRGEPAPGNRPKRAKKLYPGKVREGRRLLDRGNLSQRAIARHLGVSQPAVSHLATGKSHGGGR